MPLEKEIKKGVLKYLNSLPNCYARGKHSSPYSKGWADVIASLSGRTLALELKQPGKEPTKLQAEELAKWTRAGAITAVIRSVRDVELLLAIHQLLPAPGSDAPIGRG